MYRGLLVHCRDPNKIEILEDHLIGFDVGKGGEVRNCVGISYITHAMVKLALYFSKILLAMYVYTS